MENNNQKKNNLVIYIIGAMIIALVIRILFILILDSPTTRLIKKSVEEIKTKTALPFQVDSITTLTDITAEPDTIRYHYSVLSNLNNFTDSDLKNSLISKVCMNEDIKNLLTNEINMEYSYVVKNPVQNFLILITKEDCLNYKLPELKPLNFDNLKELKYKPE